MNNLKSHPRESGNPKINPRFRGGDKDQENWIYIWCAALIVFGVFLHLYRISANEFFFYDEGMYLNYNRNFLDLVAQNPPKNFHEAFIIVKILTQQALGTAKALWFLVMNMRVFLGGVDMDYFPRVISSVCGLATVGVTYLLARRLFQSQRVGLMSAAFLCILPSHVFYSRLAMQEAMSSLLFVSGIYLYLFPRGFGWRTFLSAVCLTGAFFTNYRMIIAPVFIFLIEFIFGFLSKQPIAWRKCVWFVVSFYAIIFGVGSLNNGANTFITFAWMFHQADMAKTEFDWVNFISFPYYLFRLENVVWGALFFANGYWLKKKDWAKFFPAAVVLLQMFLFSFASEKGARYLSVVLAFEAIAVAGFLGFLLERFSQQRERIFVYALFILLTLLSGLRSYRIAGFKSDYGKDIAMVKAVDPAARFVSTQPQLHALYLKNQRDISECPHDFATLMAKYNQGYRYLILEPQAYVSWTSDGKRFSPRLVEFLEFIREHLRPIKEFSHLDRVMLERFVFDHNENLPRSVNFLKDKNKNYGTIRIYDLRMVLDALREILGKDVKA